VRQLKLIFDFYIKSSLHLSICVAALLLITTLRLEQEPDFLILFCSFCASIVVYNFIKYASTLPYYFFVKNISIKKIQFLSFVSGFFLLVTIFFLKFQTILTGFFIFLFCVIYVIPVNRTKKNIRNYSRIKLFIVAFCWSSSSVFLPISDQSSFININTITLFFQRFFFVIIYTLPFEIRDLKYDSIMLKTIPQVYGLKKTKYFSYILIILFLLISLIIKPYNYIFIISDFIIAMVLCYIIHITQINQNKYFASFWIEGIPVFWLIIILLLKFIV
tara:strand:- start:390 stop:1214 length:825 start_codon:yes stop_codon:yes gene_type:complete